MDRAPNIRDVARRAGVGVATVSRVLNDSALVSEQTHARVRAAIEELGYRRNAHGRSLSTGRSHAVGVVAPFFTTPSVVERVRGVSERLAAQGYDLVLFDVETAAQRADAFGAFSGRDRVDGLLVVSLPISDAEAAALRHAGPSVVTIDVVHPSFPHVATDDVLGGELAAEHLLSKGHRRIGFVGDDAVNPFGFTSSERRREGFRRALRRAGVRPSDARERRGRHGREEARALAVALLRGDDRPTAIFAASDVQAVGVLEAASLLGLAVPGDLAVIGFDDIELAAVLGLTTVRQPLFETGAAGADLLLALIRAGPAGRPARPAEVELDALRVVERRTT
jgi:LacI family transcriptional regulator/LacI family repressor for deo operon, udp, cdd, tsx, nupC, and nupG